MGAFVSATFNRATPLGGGLSDISSSIKWTGRLRGDVGGTVVGGVTRVKPGRLVEQYLCLGIGLRNASGQPRVPIHLLWTLILRCEITCI